MAETLRYERRGEIDPARLDELFAAAWGRPKPGYEKVFTHTASRVRSSTGNH